LGRKVHGSEGGCRAAKKDKLQTFFLLPDFDQDRVGEEKIFEIPFTIPFNQFQSMLSLINARVSSEPCACRQSVRVSPRFLLAFFALVMASNSASGQFTHNHKLS
jgi:hypothetical protein